MSAPVVIEAAYDILRIVGMVATVLDLKIYRARVRLM